MTTSRLPWRPQPSLLLCLALFCSALTASAQTKALDPATLRLINVEASRATYRGRAATRLVGREATPAAAGGERLAILPGTQFEEGVVELDVAGLVARGASADARGFVGLAFDVAPDGSRFKSFYLRPTNGRASDQLRRNHTTQFVSIPEFPWYRLRDIEPGVYESYVDLDPVAWTHLRVVLEADRAFLYVNGADQPCLVVNDLKYKPRGGALALWIGVGTQAYFSSLKTESR